MATAKAKTVGGGKVDVRAGKVKAVSEKTKPTKKGKPAAKAAARGGKAKVKKAPKPAAKVAAPDGP